MNLKKKVAGKTRNQYVSNDVCSIYVFSRYYTLLSWCLNMFLINNIVRAICMSSETRHDVFRRLYSFTFFLACVWWRRQVTLIIRASSAWQGWLLFLGSIGFLAVGASSYLGKKYDIHISISTNSFFFHRGSWCLSTESQAYSLAHTCGALFW